MTSEVIPIEQDRDHKRKAALMKAIGFDKLPPEQREIAFEIAKRYELDLLLKHLVLVDGRPYITRDGLLHVAHRSGALDGIEVSDPELVDLPGVGQFWRATANVYRKDMSRPFRYQGRYPAKGGNQRFAPEMAVKVAEVMALRRAFDVSAPVIEERWDIPDTAPPEPLPTITDTIAAKRAAITSGPAARTGAVEEEALPLPPEPAATATPSRSETGSAEAGDPTAAPHEPVSDPAQEDAAGEVGATSLPAPSDCANVSPYGDADVCTLPLGHRNAHRGRDATWT